MNESIEEITRCIDWYNRAKSASPNDLVEVLRVISTHLYYLEGIRSEYKLKYERIIFNEVKEGNNVNRATNQAEVQVPELYLLRH